MFYTDSQKNKNKDETTKIPYLLITDPKWSSDTYVMFSDDDIKNFIPDEWVQERYQHDRDACIGYEEGSDGEIIELFNESITLESTKDTMKEEFLSDNTDIDHFWPEYSVLSVKNRDSYDLYKYYESGETRFLGNVDSAEDIDSIIDNDTLKTEIINELELALDGD